MSYDFQVVPAALSLQLPQVAVYKGRLLEAGTSSLSIGVGAVSIARFRVFSASVVPIVVVLPPIGLRQSLMRWIINPLQLLTTLSEVNVREVDFYEVPQVFPATREFVPPSYPITKTKTQSGSTVRRLWASQPSGGSLKLGFKNISDEDAEALAKLWDKTKGTRYSFTLPRRLFKGASLALVKYLELSGLPLAWGFVRQPSIASVAPGISDIELEFRARGYGVSAIPVITEPDPPKIIEVQVFTFAIQLQEVGFRKTLTINRLTPVEILLEPVESGFFVNRRFQINPISITPVVSDISFRFAKVFEVESAEIQLVTPDAEIRAIRRITVTTVEIAVAARNVDIRYGNNTGTSEKALYLWESNAPFGDSGGGPLFPIWYF